MWNYCKDGGSQIVVVERDHIRRCGGEEKQRDDDTQYRIAAGNK